MLRPALVLANFPCALVRELHIKACNFTTTSNLISQWILRLKTARQRLLAIRLFTFGETQKTELLPARDLLDTCGRMHVLGRRESRKKIYSQRSWVRNWLAMQANNDWMKLT